LPPTLRRIPMKMTFWAAEEPVCDLPEEALGKPAWGWEDLCSDIEVVTLKGSHYSILNAPHVVPFATSLRERLARVNLTSFFFRATTVSELEARYDFWADRYDAEMEHVYGSRGETHPFALVIQKYIRSGERILDAGAGTGAIGAMLEGTGIELVGIDISDGMLAVAKKKGVYADLQRMALGSELDFPSGSFDNVVSLGTFEYGHAPASSLDELVRVTSRGGHVMFSMRKDFYNSGEGGFKQKMDDLAASGYWELIDRVAFIVQHSGHDDAVAKTEMDAWVFRVQARAM